MEEIEDVQSIRASTELTFKPFRPSLNSTALEATDFQLPAI